MITCAPGPAQAARGDEAATLPELVVSVARMPQEVATLPVTVRVIPVERLAAAATIDEALREDPAFSLFRRTSSLSANPTAQGVSLRGVGPSGASRTAVLLDDIPLNDPFGGWVTWGQVPVHGLAAAEIVHGGGSGAWGNAALGGTVALVTAPPGPTGGRLAVEAGSHGHWRADLTTTHQRGADALRLDASLGGRDGFHPLPPASRGAVDRRLSTEHRLGQATWRHAFSGDTEARLTARLFEEDRGNGTALQDNATRIAHLSAVIEGRDGVFPAWKVAAWAQRQRYSSFFTAVSADRMQETPANDQFAVPASAGGLLATRILRSGRDTTLVGLEVRLVEGETREDYLFRDGAFAQRRTAGGAQRTVALFLQHDRTRGPWRLSGALRADHWATTDGRLRERSLESGATTRDESFADRDGLVLSPRLGVSTDLTPRAVLRASAYRAFRVPTLNEYHRPFRIGSTSTLANPALDPETLDGIDLAFEARLDSVRVTLGGFWNQMHDAVGNVTLSAGPGGTTRQRQNIDTTRIRGLEAAAEWSPAPAVRLRAAVQGLDARVIRARAQPTLEGRRVAQVPRVVATAALDWRIAPHTRLHLHARGFTRQFEDDENRLPLAAAWVAGLRVEHRVRESITGFLAIDNLLDRRVETGRSTAGLVTLDQPRSGRAGLTVSW